MFVKVLKSLILLRYRRNLIFVKVKTARLLRNTDCIEKLKKEATCFWLPLHIFLN
ncbi:hypothetical protein MYP_4120 [Sporocytophaga myxococcoides]|uniref:Uncharacterized protein n=1 Tax=Sporocytophaga myxococcoides TaxID=153721 RepID=A0A098LIX1_9BACT|nr:hypothetical protein MYP_4120 [Sporocytophaga myxococcoides]